MQILLLALKTIRHIEDINRREIRKVAHTHTQRQLKSVQMQCQRKVREEEEEEGEEDRPFERRRPA